MTEGVTQAVGGQRHNVNGVKHGLHALDARLRGRNLGAIDKRTTEGREALAFAEDALKRKGGASCPPYLKVDIKLATFDLFRLLHLQAFLVSDINERGTPVNRRHRQLPRIHEQYTAIEERFTRRVEGLALDKPLEIDPVKELYEG